VLVGKIRELRSRREDLPGRISFRERNVMLPSGMKATAQRAWWWASMPRETLTRSF
jgi:hypothetical protein